MINDKITKCIHKNKNTSTYKKEFIMLKVFDFSKAKLQYNLKQKGQISILY
jgi:hypothetical protein